MSDCPTANDDLILFELRVQRPASPNCEESTEVLWVQAASEASVSDAIRGFDAAAVPVPPGIEGAVALSGGVDYVLPDDFGRLRVKLLSWVSEFVSN